MRLEAASGGEAKVWLTDEEVEDLRRATASHRNDLIIQLGAYVGLRAFEIPQVRPTDIKTTEAGQYRLHIPAGKDTTGNGGKPRDAFLPADVERDLQRYQNAENIAPKDTFINLSTDSVRKVVIRAADKAAEMTGDDNVRDAMLEEDRAEELLQYLRRCEYASRPHVVIALMWHTMMRVGAIHSLDVEDFAPEESP